ncbi:helix-turn-helix transcriptional regulator [Bilophila wadsworthia]|uniref:helix-turn-helix transcriptional regulator n=1 Tax=Bilophila wadsworthia TaxID=35833 RepID=UPI003AF7E812
MKRCSFPDHEIDLKGDGSLLTPHEQEVSALASDRLNAKEIAARLCISVHTVNTILKSVYRKFGVSGKAKLRNIRPC